jgi:hypothetical protein
MAASRAQESTPAEHIGSIISLINFRHGKTPFQNGNLFLQRNRNFGRFRKTRPDRDGMDFHDEYIVNGSESYNPCRGNCVLGVTVVLQSYIRVHVPDEAARRAVRHSRHIIYSSC